MKMTREDLQIAKNQFYEILNYVEFVSYSKHYNKVSWRASERGKLRKTSVPEMFKHLADTQYINGADSLFIGNEIITSTAIGSRSVLDWYERLHGDCHRPDTLTTKYMSLDFPSIILPSSLYDDTEQVSDAKYYEDADDAPSDADTLMAVAFGHDMHVPEFRLGGKLYVDFIHTDDPNFISKKRRCLSVHKAKGNIQYTFKIVRSSFFHSLELFNHSED